jgi:hypothetical protein
MKSTATILAAALLASAATAQPASPPVLPPAPLPAEPSPTAPPLTEGATVTPALEAEESAWSFSIAATAYFVSEGRDYVQPTVMLDHDWLHLEARYNYEALDTGSVWFGYNFGGGGGDGEVFSWDFTPMIGVVFGETEGVAPGYELTLAWELGGRGGGGSWGTLEFYSEGEYVFDTDESSDSFFYNWSSLTVAPETLGGLSLGIVTQRTRAFESDHSVQVGPIIGFSTESVSFSAYVLGLDDDPIYALSCSIGF